MIKLIAITILLQRIYFEQHDMRMHKKHDMGRLWVNFATRKHAIFIEFPYLKSWLRPWYTCFKILVKRQNMSINCSCILIRNLELSTLSLFGFQIIFIEISMIMVQITSGMMNRHSMNQKPIKQPHAQCDKQQLAANK